MKFKIKTNKERREARRINEHKVFGNMSKPVLDFGMSINASEEAISEAFDRLNERLARIRARNPYIRTVHVGTTYSPNHWASSSREQTTSEAIYEATSGSTRTTTTNR